MEQLDIINEIQIKYTSFSKGQKKIADYVLSNYEKAAFMTAKKLGTESGTSESSAVRFAFELGFESYTLFQKAIASLIQKKLTSPSEISVSLDTGSPKGILRSILKNDSDNIARTLDIIDYISFENAIDYITTSKKVYIIGLRSCKILSNILYLNLNMIRDNVVEISTSSTAEIFEQLIHLSSDDCVIGIGFPDYSVRTLKALEFANERKSKIVTITDNRYSPMLLYSSCNLFAACDSINGIESLTAPLSIVNALIMGIQVKCNKEYQSNVNDLNDIWENYNS